MSDLKTETRAVLAGAYKASNPKGLLTHSAKVDASGDVVSVACKRVQIESLADAFAQDTTLAPTCPRCAKETR